MVKLNDMKKKSLTYEDLQKYPVWTWDDSNEYLVPLSELQPSWYDYENYFIKAQFSTQEYIFNGYLVGIESFYAFGLFIDNTEVGFNANLPKINHDQLKYLFNLLNCKPFEFFPIEYQSPVFFKEGKKIKGILNFRTKND